MNKTFSPESLQKLTKTHPESVSLLFADFGITKEEITVEDIYNAYLAFGDLFLTRLYDLTTKSNLSGFDFNSIIDLDSYGTDMSSSSPEDASNQASGYAESKNWLDKALEGLTKVGGIVKSVKDIVGPNNNKSNNATTPNQGAEKSSMLTTGLFIAIGAIVLLVIMVVVIKVVKK